MAALLTLALLSGLPSAASADAPCVAASDTNRCPSWIARYTNPAGPGLTCDGWDSMRGIAVDTSGIYMTGESCDDASQSYRMVTVAFDAATGAKRWAVVRDGPNGGSDYGKDIALSPSGDRVYVTGIQDETATTWLRGDAVTIAYDTATGQQVWASTYNGIADLYDELTQIAVSADGQRVYAAGYSWGAPTKQTPVEGTPDGDYDALVVAYDAATGERLWIHRQDDPQVGSDEAALGIGLLGDRIFFGGYASFGAGVDFEAWALDDGQDHRHADLVWRQSAGVPGNEYPTIGAMGVSADGVVLAGIADVGPAFGPCGFHTKWAVAAFDTDTGANLWSDSYEGPTLAGNEVKGLAMSPDGNTAFVTGWTTSDTTACITDTATIAYRVSDGTRAWTAKEQLPGITHQGWSIAASPNGEEVYMGGIEYYWMTRLKGDAHTVAYDADNGTRLWSARYNDSSAALDLDNPYLLATSVDGGILYAGGGFNHPVDGAPMLDFYETSVLAYLTG